MIGINKYSVLRIKYTPKIKHQQKRHECNIFGRSTDTNLCGIDECLRTLLHEWATNMVTILSFLIATQQTRRDNKKTSAQLQHQRSRYACMMWVNNRQQDTHMSRVPPLNPRQLAKIMRGRFSPRLKSLIAWAVL